MYVIFYCERTHHKTQLITINNGRLYMPPALQSALQKNEYKKRLNLNSFHRYGKI